MRNIFLAFGFLFSFLTVKAQMTVVNSTPTDGQVGVASGTFVSITFSSAVDTSVRFHEGNYLLTNIFSRVGNISPDSISFSADRKTLTINVPLKPDKDYFVLLYGISASDGSKMTSPYLIRFTTSVSFQGKTVSGTVIPDPAASDNIAVILLDPDVPEGGDPELKYCTVPNSEGNFSIPAVQAGDYLAIGVTDFEGDGVLDFDEGNDLLSFGRTFTVNDSDITDLEIDFQNMIVVDSSPLNGATSVYPGDDIYVYFNYSLNENIRFKDVNFLITNLYNDLDNALTDSISIVEDHRKLEFETNLKRNQDYFILLWGIYSYNNKRMTKPFLTRFTTAASFSGYTVSGNISVKENCCTAENSVVFLAENLGEDGPPTFDYCGIVDEDGNYSIPYVKPGTYIPIVVKDLNNDGSLEIDYGIDPIGIGDSIVVTNSDVGGVDLTLGLTEPYDFSNALDSANSIVALEPNWINYHLKFVKGWGIVNTHYPTVWEFFYFDSLQNKAMKVEMGAFYTDVDRDYQSGKTWLSNFKNLDSYISRVGNLDKFLNSVFTHDLTPVLNYQAFPPYRKEIYVELGQLSQNGFQDMTPDPNGIYWGAVFSVVDTTNVPYQIPPKKIIRFLGDYQTGDLIAVNKVKKEDSALPKKFTLEQNYPNPFSAGGGKSAPTTRIKFSLPFSTRVTLKVYDILGRVVATLVNKNLSAGSYTATFKALNLPAGVYIYRLEAGKYSITKKMMLVK